MPSTFNIPAGALVGIWGDSLNDKAFPYQMMSLCQRAAAAAEVPSSVNIKPGGSASTVTAPRRFINNAVNGSTITAMNTTIDNTVGLNVYTHIIICTGTNERTRTRAQTQADITTCAGKFGTLPVLLVGPAAWGWLYPGPNVIAGSNDTRLNETNTDLGTLFVATHPNVVYVDLRTPMWTTQVAPGTTNGLTGADDLTVDGVHWTPAGRAAAWTIISPVVTFT